MDADCIIDIMDADCIPHYQKQQNVHDVDFDGSIKPTSKLDVYSNPQYQKEKVNAVDYYVPSYFQKPSLSDHQKQKENLGCDESNHLQKLSLSAHHEQKKKNLGGRIKPNSKLDIYSNPQYQKEKVDAVDYSVYAVPNYLQKPSLSGHHKQKENLGGDESKDLRNLSLSVSLSALCEQKKMNLGGDGSIKPTSKLDVYSNPQCQKEKVDAVDCYVPNYIRKAKQKENLGGDVPKKQKEKINHLEESEKARAMLTLKWGCAPADYFYKLDPKLRDEALKRSAKEESAWREANTCTSCRGVSWKCACKRYQEWIGGSAETQQKKPFPWLTTNRCSPNAPQYVSSRK